MFNKIIKFENFSSKKKNKKIIGSSLEATIKIKLKKDLYKLAKEFDFAELCITSGAELINDDSISNEIIVETFKAEGEKCNVCWKIKKEKCDRHNI